MSLDAVTDYLGGYLNLPPAFHFNVVPMNPLFAPAALTDAAFAEISGIEATIEVDALSEGGENRFAHQLPSKISHANLQLKRGVAPLTSFLVVWCKSVFDGGFNQQITTKHLLVNLLDENGLPVRSWGIFNAFPVKWQVEGFISTKNEVAIEQIELSYQYCERIL